MTELQLALLLRRQLTELNKNPVEGFSAGLIDGNDLFENRGTVFIFTPPSAFFSSIEGLL
uniref:Uncharacterized protein n=1 Tax=Vombatus ursinus TaxID=29139 RepID=A0A4X2KNE7_VOMUR